MNIEHRLLSAASRPFMPLTCHPSVREAAIRFGGTSWGRPPEHHSTRSPSNFLYRLPMPMRTQKGSITPRKMVRSPNRPFAPSKSTPSRRNAEKPEIHIFVSYSHADAGARDKLQTHLAALMRDNVSVWFDVGMDAGDALDSGIARALRRAHILVALLSPDYLASRYCWNIEYRRAMNRRARGTMRVVAAVVRPCDWKATRAAGFKLLPRDGRPVIRWRSADDAFLNIAEGIRSVVKTLRREMTTAPVKPSRTPTSPKSKAKKTSSSQVAAASKAIRAPAQSRSGKPRP